MSIEADQLDADTIKKIEEAVATLPSNLTDPYRPKRVNGVPRHALLHPTHGEGRLQGQTFSLGDRVVYVQNSGKVDIAMRGTVVGINAMTLDVFLDAPIMNGLTLGGRCSENRGSIVPKSSVLNLTNPTIVALSKAALQRKPNEVLSEDNSKTASPADHATRSQFTRSGQRGRGRGGNWYTPWGINTPQPDISMKSKNLPKQSAPFNPTVLLRKSQQSNAPTPLQSLPHQYRDGVAIPPPTNLEQRQRKRSGPLKSGPEAWAVPSEQFSARGTNAFRGGRGRGGPMRGGAANGSPGNSGRGGGGGGRGRRGHGTAQSAPPV